MACMNRDPDSQFLSGFDPLTQLNSNLILILNKASNMMFHVTTLTILEINSSVTLYCTYSMSIHEAVPLCLCVEQLNAAGGAAPPPGVGCCFYLAGSLDRPTRDDSD
jgi:hypothetical protein